MKYLIIFFALIVFYSTLTYTLVTVQDARNDLDNEINENYNNITIGMDEKEVKDIFLRNKNLEVSINEKLVSLEETSKGDKSEINYQMSVKKEYDLLNIKNESKNDFTFKLGYIDGKVFKINKLINIKDENGE